MKRNLLGFVMRYGTNEENDTLLEEGLKTFELSEKFELKKFRLKMFELKKIELSKKSSYQKSSSYQSLIE